MKCKILNDIPGRLRVHLCCGHMTLKSADVLEYCLRAVDGVKSVKLLEHFDHLFYSLLYYENRSENFGAPIRRGLPAKAANISTVLRTLYLNKAAQSIKIKIREKLKSTKFKICVIKVYFSLLNR